MQTTDSAPSTEKVSIWQKNRTNIFKFVLFLIPLAIVLYLAINLYQTYTYKDTYNIDFAGKVFKNTTLPLYVNDDPGSGKFGESVIDNDTNYRRVTGSPLSFIWKPEEFPLNKKITVSVTMQDEGDWDIAYQCPDCTETQKPQWNTFYFGKIKNYAKSAEFDNVKVYTKQNLSQSKEEKDLIKWLDKNISPKSSIAISDDLQNKFNVANKDIQNFDINEKRAKINYAFRGTQRFYVVLDKKIELSVTKKDLNYAEGADDVYAILSDFNNKEIFRVLIEDDGNSSNKSSTNDSLIEKKIVKDIPQKGIYLLSFEEGTKNKWPDFIINHIEINTDKIVTDGSTVLLESPAQLYTETAHSRNLYFNIWMPIGLQKIEVNSENDKKQLELTDQDYNINRSISLTPGKYSINIPGSEQYVSGSYFSFSPENYFDPMQYDFLETTSEPDVIITDRNFNYENNWLTAEQTYSKEDFKSIKNPKKIEFILKSPQINELDSINKTLKNKGFTSITNYNDYVLWGKTPNSNPKTDYGDVTSWLQSQAVLDTFGNVGLILTQENMDFGPINNKIIKHTISDYIFDQSIDFVLTKNPPKRDIFIKEFKITVE